MSCQELPGAARRLPNVPRSFQDVPDGAKLSQTLQISFRTLSQTLPDGNFQLSCKEVGIGLIEQLNCTELSSFNKLTELTD